MSDAEKYQQLIRAAREMLSDDEASQFIHWFEQQAEKDGVDPALVAEIVKDWNDG